MLLPPRTCPGCICFSRAWMLGVTMQAAATMAPSASALPYNMHKCWWLCCNWQINVLAAALACMLSPERLWCMARLRCGWPPGAQHQGSQPLEVSNRHRIPVCPA